MVSFIRMVQWRIVSQNALIIHRLSHQEAPLECLDIENSWIEAYLSFPSVNVNYIHQNFYYRMWLKLWWMYLEWCNLLQKMCQGILPTDSWSFIDLWNLRGEVTIKCNSYCQYRSDIKLGKLFDKSRCKLYC